MPTFLLRQTVRRLRGRLARSDFKGVFPLHSVFHFLSALVLLLLVFSGVPVGFRPAVDSAVPGESIGEVAGATQSAVNDDNLWPKRIPDSPEAPFLTAKSVLVVDGAGGKTLYEKNPRESLPPASTTKIITALVTLKNHSLSEVASVPLECLAGLDGQAQMGLIADEKLTVETLLYGLLLNSASDAACTLAGFGQTPTEFVGLMNLEAARLGLSETHFENPVGLDGEQQRSSAADLLTLAKEAMCNPEFRKIVGTAEIKVHDALTPPTRWHGLKSTNTLLTTLPGITGVKTGRTEDAGECLIASWFHEDHEIYAVILGSSDRFAEMTALLDWVKRVYSFGPAEASSQLPSTAGR